MMTSDGSAQLMLLPNASVAGPGAGADPAVAVVLLQQKFQGASESWCTV